MSKLPSGVVVASMLLRSMRSRSSLIALAMLALTAVCAPPASAVLYNFDDNSTVPFEDTYVFQQSVSATARRSTVGPSSAPNAYVLAGTASSNGREFAYMHVFDTNIYVTSGTRLHYRVFPVNALSRYVAVDLTFSDGRVLRESGILDDRGVLLHGNAQPQRLQVGAYNDVYADLGSTFYGTRVTKIRVAFDSPGGTGGFEARFDDISVEDSSFVQIEGDKVDENDAPFFDDRAILDPNGGGSTCGPDLATQDSVCGGGVSHYVARARAYSKGYAKLSASIPLTDQNGVLIDRDVLISVCSDAPGTFEGRFGCRDHPEESYCRPKQTSSKARVNIWLPPAVGFMDVRWRYVPAAVAGAYPACDKSGAFPRIVQAAAVNAGPFLGDEDKDGAVTATDGIMVLRCAAGLRRCLPARSDVDCDGEFTSADARNVFRLAGNQLIHVGGECDRDDDGLLDEWEQFGYDANGDGTIDVPLNKPPFNASSARKDIFVECDYMQDATHTHQLLLEATSLAVAMYQGAPIDNIDSTRGILLHVDSGQMGGGSAIPHQTVLDSDECGQVHEFREKYMEPKRRSIFHYCVLVHHDEADPEKQRGGKNCDDDLSEFYISQGEERSSERSPKNQAASLAHELGHDLNLRHGGFERQNFKPNYLSIMNYFFSYGIPYFGQENLLDFSRFEVQPLDEERLNETAGMHAVGGDNQLFGYGTKWYDKVHGDQVQVQHGVLTNIDWSGANGNAETSVEVDLNHEEGTNVIRSWSDWDHVQLRQGTIGAIGTVASNWGSLDQPVGNPCDDFPLP